MGKIIKQGGWVYHLTDREYKMLSKSGEEYIFDSDVGKWMIFYKTFEEAFVICCLAINNSIVEQAKHPEDYSKCKDGIGPTCFYLRGNDIEAHKRFFSFFMEKGLLPENKNGAYTNIAYKYDIDTAFGIYGKGGALHLKDFINPMTGEWTGKVLEYDKKESQKEEIRSRTSQYLGKAVDSFWGSDSPLHKGDTVNIELLNRYMEQQGQTPKSIAELLGAYESTVNNWLIGKSRPKAQYAIALCVYLGMNQEDFIIKKTV